MRNYSKYYFLMAIAMVSGCRSHKAIEESTYVAADSCKVETSLNVQSLMNIAATQSSDSSVRQDHFDFEEGAGIIQIHPNGEVTIKGLKSALLSRQSEHKTVDIQISESDTLSAEYNSQSSSTEANEVRINYETSSQTSRWVKFLFLAAVILLVICTKYAVHYVKKRNELRKM